MGKYVATVVFIPSCKYMFVVGLNETLKLPALDEVKYFSIIIFTALIRNLYYAF